MWPSSNQESSFRQWSSGRECVCCVCMCMCVCVPCVYVYVCRVCVYVCVCCVCKVICLSPCYNIVGKPLFSMGHLMDLPLCSCCQPLPRQGLGTPPSPPHNTSLWRSMLVTSLMLCELTEGMGWYVKTNEMCVQCSEGSPGPDQCEV